MDNKVKNILQKFSTHKVELKNLVQELERNAEIAKGEVKSLQNLAARMEYNFR